jgi:hypothetical protein
MKKPWRCYNLVQGAWEIARDGDYARGTICCAHSQADADLLVRALNLIDQTDAETISLRDQIGKLYRVCNERDVLRNALTGIADKVDDERADLDEVLSMAEMALLQTPAVTLPGQIGGTWRHRKRGSVYPLVEEARLQTDGATLSDMEPMRVYRAADGSLWVRSAAEFHDGRFEELSASERVEAPK